MGMLVWWWVGSAWAGWTDAWSDSRWVIEVREALPVPLELSAVEDRSFRTRYVELGAVLACGEAFPIGKHTIELDCEIETSSLRVAPRGDQGPAGGDVDVLLDVQQRLDGTVVRLGLSEDGALISVDLPEVPATNRREAESREVLRALMADLASPLHLRRPTDWSDGWKEKGSDLLRAPSQPQTSGSSALVHTVSAIDGHTVVSSVGSGTFTTPWVPWQFDAAENVPHTVGPATNTRVGRPKGLFVQPLVGVKAQDGIRPGVAPPPATTPELVLFAADLTSVAIVDPDGRPLERVWSMAAAPSGAGIGALQGTSVGCDGRLRRLDAGELPDLGPSGFVAPGT